jgi:hypothetical protein
MMSTGCVVFSGTLMAESMGPRRVTTPPVVPVPGLLPVVFTSIAIWRIVPAASGSVTPVAAWVVWPTENSRRARTTSRRPAANAVPTVTRTRVVTELIDNSSSCCSRSCRKKQACQLEGSKVRMKRQRPARRLCPDAMRRSRQTSAAGSGAEKRRGCIGVSISLKQRLKPNGYNRWSWIRAGDKLAEGIADLLIAVWPM